jgi:hypothetical protein
MQSVRKARQVGAPSGEMPILFGRKTLMPMKLWDVSLVVDKG